MKQCLQRQADSITRRVAEYTILISEGTAEISVASLALVFIKNFILPLILVTMRHTLLSALLHGQEGLERLLFFYMQHAYPLSTISCIKVLISISLNAMPMLAVILVQEVYYSPCVSLKEFIEKTCPLWRARALKYIGSKTTLNGVILLYGV